jgi:FkbM family methyltransferase
LASALPDPAKPVIQIVAAGVSFRPLQVVCGSEMSQILARAKAAISACRKPFDIAIARSGSLDAFRYRLETLRRNRQTRGFVQSCPNEQWDRISQLTTRSKSQNRQDLFVLSELNFKRDGFFVEFGAAGGIEDSNTYLLEEEFGWRGILAEPARAFHERLRANPRAHISTKCVWSESKKLLTFNEANWPYLSTVDAFSARDLWAERRQSGRTYDVETISLVDLLAEFSAPAEIDYLSIDTEGTELTILQSFDFTKYRFSIITCEHNFTPDRERIRALLERHGYVRKREQLSRYDDWYVHRDLRNET